MRNRWTRENIIRELAQRRATGLGLTVGGKGVGLSLYGAARRIFGSWRNAIQAAGILPQEVLTWERWSPARILVMIRHLAARDRQLTTDEMDRRYNNLTYAARRHFGSWSKAVLASGVNPTRMLKVKPWNRERVIEGILTRALRNESMVARFVEPRSLVGSAQRFFGGWKQAVAAAGLDPALTVPASKRNKAASWAKAPTSSANVARRPYTRWSKEDVTAALHARLSDGKPVHSNTIAHDDSRLYDAMRRCFGSYEQAMRAAGLDPEGHRRRPLGPSRTPDGARDGASVSRPSQTNDALGPDRPT